MYPLFIQEGDIIDEIASMPGCMRHSLQSMLEEVEDSMRCATVLMIRPIKC